MRWERGARLAATSLALSLVAGCGDDEGDTSGGGAAGAGGEGGGGSPAACGSDEIPQPDGSCRAVAVGAGVASCGAGFEPDGAEGCSAVLPPDPCGAGLMAIPGETACRPIADCGAAPWGTLPSGNLQFVDPTYAGGDSDGSEQKPWATLQSGLAAAPDGATLVLAQGDYPGPVSISTSIVLWGRCPDLVRITSSDTVDPALVIEANDVAVRGVAVSGAFIGVGVSAGVSGFSLSDARIHDTAAEGALLFGPGSFDNVLVEDTLSTGVAGIGVDVVLDGVVLRRSGYIGVAVGDGGALSVASCLLEHNGRVGILMDGATLSVRDTLIRDMQPVGGIGTGIHTQLDDIAMVGTDVSVTGAVIERTYGTGIHLGGAHALIDNTVVRDMVPDAQGNGRGIDVLEEGVPAEVDVVHSVVANAVEYGVTAINDTMLALDHVIVRDVAPLPMPVGLEYLGNGVAGFIGGGGSIAPNVALDGCIVERTTEAGVVGLGATVHVADSIIRGVRRHPDSGLFGRGVSAQPSMLGPVGGLEVLGSLLRDNAEVGIVAFGPLALLVEDSYVADTAGEPTDPIGWGIGMQDTADGVPIANILRTGVVRAREAGIVLLGASLTLSDSYVTETAVGAMGAFGDGVVLSTTPAANSATITGSRFTHNARAGVATFQGEVAISNSVIACNTVDLNVDALTGEPTGIVDAGQNSCDCDADDDDEMACQVLRSSLTPPSPI